MTALKFILFIFCLLPTSIYSIINGTIAKPHQFPYMTLVFSPQFYCAGTLISPKYILTAAHCLMSIKKGNPAKVSLGAYEFRGGTSSDGNLIICEKFWIHENFSMPFATNDIGLIELPEAIIVSNKINFIEIDTRMRADYDESDRDVILSGWGNEQPGKVSHFLRFTSMKLMPFNECKKFKNNYIESLTENHICAEKVDNMPCDGDSGSSLVSLKTKKIVGILSYVKDAEDGHNMGYNDCQSKIPAVATRVSSYLGWIADKSGLKFS